MTPQTRLWIACSLAALAIGSPAGAQLVSPGRLPWNLSTITPYSGVLTPFQYRLPTMPNDSVVPYRSYIPYPVPQPVYVPVETAPERPALEPMQVTVVTLRPGTTPPPVRVKPDGIITWVNASDRTRTLVIDSVSTTEGDRWSNRQSGVARPDSSLSLAFHQAGTYDYYLSDEPTRRARITVAASA